MVRSLVQQSGSETVGVDEIEADVGVDLVDAAVIGFGDVAEFVEEFRCGAFDVGHAWIIPWEGKRVKEKIPPSD